jgi:hypothetical protein
MSDRLRRPPYTAQQWAAIERAVQKAAPGALSVEERKHLSWMGLAYSSKRHSWRSIVRRDRKDRGSWQRLVKLSSDARAVLKQLDQDWSEEQRATDYYRRSIAEPASWLAAIVDLAGEYAGLWGGIASIDDEIRQRFPTTTARRMLRRDSPQAWFVSLVADFWVRRGGKLATSFDPVRGRVFGPFVNYFQAVAAPILKKDTPTLQSLRRIVRREKLLQKAWREFGAQGAGKNGSAVDHAPVTIAANDMNNAHPIRRKGEHADGRKKAKASKETSESRHRRTGTVAIVRPVSGEAERLT